MYVKKLALLNYRNYGKTLVEFKNGTNVIYGPNGIGKTNLLEAIYFLSYSRSHRNSLEADLIEFNKEFAKISASVNVKNSDKIIEVGLFKNKNKQISVNKVAITKTSDLLGFLNVVMFCPENLRIVKGSPKERRRTIDMGMCRFGRKYLKVLLNYHKILEQRNKILKTDAESDVLDVFTEQLASCGAELYTVRKNYIKKLSEKADIIHKEICGDTLSLEYKSGIYIENEENLQLSFLNELENNLEKDKFSKVTMCGCHRDDFKIYINGIEAKTFASQGQQRTAAIAIKMAELELLKEFYGETPVLLLDDVLSELDNDRQNYILNKIKGAQVIITCTEADKFINENVNLIDAEKLRCSYI